MVGTVNAKQTNDERRAKYMVIQKAGFNTDMSIRARDWTWNHVFQVIGANVEGVKARIKSRRLEVTNKLTKHVMCEKITKLTCRPRRIDLKFDEPFKDYKFPDFMGIMYVQWGKQYWSYKRYMKKIKVRSKK